MTFFVLLGFDWHKFVAKFGASPLFFVVVVAPSFSMFAQLKRQTLLLAPMEQTIFCFFLVFVAFFAFDAVKL